MTLDKLLHRCSTWVLLLFAALMFIAGCAKHAAAPLPPGALNTFDADSFRVLSDAHAAIQSIRDDAAAGKITLDAGQRAVVDKVIADDNTANHLYRTYHASGSGDTAALSQAIQALVGDLAALSTAFPQQPAPAK